MAAKFKQFSVYFFIFILSLILLCFNFSHINKVRAYSDTKYETYTNARYGFSINYPSDFIRGIQPTNEDGLQFASPDKKAILTVYGSNNIYHDTLEGMYNRELTALGKKVSYKTLNKDWYVISWVESKNIYYRKVYLGEGSTNSFIFIYPEQESKVYNKIAETLNMSFKPGDLKNSH